MSYYDHATYIALELSSQNKQEHLNGWQLEREFVRQRQSMKRAQRVDKPRLSDRARQIYKQLFGPSLNKLGPGPKQL